MKARVLKKQPKIALLYNIETGKSADCVAVKLDFPNLLHMLDSQIVKCTALIYTKEHLVAVDCSI